MGRRRAILIVASIFLVSFVGTGIVVWQLLAPHIPLFYVLGGLVVVLGIGLAIMHLSVTDEYLRQHFGGEENASRMREFFRGGWVGIVVGAVLIAAGYFLGAG